MFFKKSKLFIYILLLLIILSLLTPICCLSFSEDSIYVWSNTSSSVSTSISPSEKELSDDNKANNSGNFLNITSGSAILIDQKTGNVLYEYNSHEQLRPASVT